MSRGKAYMVGFVGCCAFALVLAVTLDTPFPPWGIFLVIAAYGQGMYFQGRWHEMSDA